MAFRSQRSPCSCLFALGLVILSTVLAPRAVAHAQEEPRQIRDDLSYPGSSNGTDDCPVCFNDNGQGINSTSEPQSNVRAVCVKLH